MDWFLFAIFFCCNIGTILICQYASKIDDKYRNGMILGVHIPSYEVQNEEVQAICKRGIKKSKKFHRMSFLIGTFALLIGFYSMEVAIIIWMICLAGYMIGVWYVQLQIYREMYQLKVKHNWYDEQTKKIRMSSEKNYRGTEYIDDDVYWLKGWYSNPNDKRVLVENKFSTMNMSFNLAKPGVKLFVGLLYAVTIVVVIGCIYMLVPLIHIEYSLETKGQEVRIEGGGYDVEFTLDEIKQIQLSKEMPTEKLSRRNGGSTSKYRVGKFRGSESGDVMLFLFEGYSPVLKITLENQVIYVNSKEPEETKAWYELVYSQME